MDRRTALATAAAVSLMVITATMVVAMNAISFRSLVGSDDAELAAGDNGPVQVGAQDPAWEQDPWRDDTWDTEAQGAAPQEPYTYVIDVPATPGAPVIQTPFSNPVPIYVPSAPVYVPTYTSPAAPAPRATPTARPSTPSANPGSSPTPAPAPTAPLPTTTTVTPPIVSAPAPRLPAPAPGELPSTTSYLSYQAGAAGNVGVTVDPATGVALWGVYPASDEWIYTVEEQTTGAVAVRFEKPSTGRTETIRLALDETANLQVTTASMTRN